MRNGLIILTNVPIIEMLSHLKTQKDRNSVLIIDYLTFKAPYHYKTSLDTFVFFQF